ncbi:MAG: hypothetical protein ACE5IR_14270 [bacterium]
MQKNMNKYFWDGELNVSEEYKLKRIIEYASFPDLIDYPVEDLKKYLPAINIDELRTSEKRKTFIKLILPFIAESQSWDDIVTRMIST